MSIYILALVATIGFEYLSVDPVAHRTGMGYALFGDGYSVHYNPGGLAFCQNTYYSTSYLNYIGGTHFGYLGYERNQIGLGLRYFYSGRMKKTDESGIDYGSFGVHFIDINVGKGFFYKEFGLGVSIKGVYANIDTLNSIGLGADIGALYIFPEIDIQVGLSIKNIGFGIKPFLDAKETFPYEFIISGAKKFKDGWIGLDLLKPALSSFGLHFGGAYYLTPNISLKASYNSLLSSIRTRSSGFDVLAGLTIGIAINKDKICINYCYSPYFDLGAGHRISISLGG